VQKSVIAVSPDWDPTFASSRMHGERAQFEFMRETLRFVPRRRTAVDVGAHIGLWSRNLAPLFQSVVAFEPVEENRKCFIQNTSGLPNVQLLPYAVGDQRAHVELVLPANANSGMHRVSGDGSGCGLGEPNMLTLDETSIADVDLIKIDVEGYEGRVLRGAVNLICRDRPVIVYEDNGLGQKYFGADWIDPEPIMRALNYRLRLNWRKDKIWVPK